MVGSAVAESFTVALALFRYISFVFLPFSPLYSDFLWMIPPWIIASVYVSLYHLISILQYSVPKHHSFLCIFLH